MLILDCEIIRAIPDKKHPRQEGIEYCEGWHDFKGMGLSVVCTFDYDRRSYGVFLEDNWMELAELFTFHDVLVGFNNIGFDNRLLEANGFYMDAARSYDILREVWIAAGLAPEFEYPSHIGYGLNDLLAANFPDFAKSGDGALAPIWWQQGRIGRVINYCLRDVLLTKMLLDKIVKDGTLIDPKHEGNILQVRKPDQAPGMAEVAGAKNG